MHTQNHDCTTVAPNKILQESLAHEIDVLRLYLDLLRQVQGSSVLLEEYAHTMIVREKMHESEVGKMLRKSGDSAP